MFTRLLAPVFAALLAIGFAPTAPAAERDVSLALATDLARDLADAASDGRALLVLYSLPGCPWCARARREHLGAMARDPDEQKRVLIREIDITSDAALVAPDGSRTTHRAFARAHRIRLTPTTGFLARDGSDAAEAIVGYPPAGFYGAYLEQRIEQARRRAP